MQSKFRAVLVAIVLLAVGLSATPALAGTYTVRQCDHAAGIGQHDFRWQAAGDPAVVQNPGSGCGEFGLAARNGAVGSERTYPSGGYGGWFAYAPTGTAITRFAGSFGTLVGCCINGMATYAEASAPGTGAFLFQGSLGNDSWYAPSGLQGPVGRSWDGGFAAKSVGFYLRCAPGPCFQRKTGDLRLRGRSFDFTLRDDSTPALGVPGGTLMAGGWLRATRSLSFAAADVGGGLTGVTASFDNGTALSAPSSCSVTGGRYVRLQPCPLARSGSWSVDTARLPDGVRTLTLRAADVGDAAAIRTRTLAVDNTAPAAPIGSAVVGDPGWRSANGFVLRWTNPGGQHAPIAHAHVEACPVGGGGCVAQRWSAAGIEQSRVTLPRAGEWNARVWLEDAAGNVARERVGQPQRLRFDPDPPTLRFRAADSAAPASVGVDVSDSSGIASGGIDMRRWGSRAWEPLPTARQGSRLTAEIDDSVRSGLYELRARATDLAGNQTVVDGPQRRLPLRDATRLQAAIVRSVVRRRPRCRGWLAHRCLSRTTVRRRVARIRHRSLLAVHGRLSTRSGQPLAERQVAVSLISRDRSVGRPPVRTDAAGRFALLMRARRSAVVALRFAGDRRARPSRDRLALHVPAPVSIRVDRRRVRGGRSIAFHGRVSGGALPRRGKLVEIQAHFRRRWRTISTVRSNRHGGWRFAYAFQPSARAVAYRLRARAPGESGYPFAAGISRAVRVTVLPR